MLIRDVVNWFRYDANYSTAAMSFAAKVKWYCVIALLTFGYTANAEEIIAANGADLTVLLALPCGVFWPLYWSQEVFSWLI
jgi:hypothetical protein